MKKNNSLRHIYLLKIFKGLNSIIYDLLWFFFSIIAIKNIEHNSGVVNILIGVSLFLLVVQFLINIYQKIPFYYWTSNKIQTLLVSSLALYGFYCEYNLNYIYFFFGINIILINLIIRIFINHFLNMKEFSVSKKETLFHELGHYYVCKEYNILDPDIIDLNTEGSSMGRLITEGDFEKVEPIKIVTMLLAGYVTEKYLIHNKKKFDLRELRNILLVEYEDKNFSDEYLETLIVIYLRENIINNIVNNIMDIIDKYRDDIFTKANENKYKKLINVKLWG